MTAAPILATPQSDNFPSPHLDNSLQLTRIPERVLDNRPTELLLLGRRIAALGGVGRVREVYVAVTNGPAALAGEVDNSALALEEEEGFGGGDRKGGIGLFGRRRYLRADL